MSVKIVLKDMLMKRLHAVAASRYELASNLASAGVREFASFDYAVFRKSVLDYLETLRVGQFEYRFAKSRKMPVLYGSVYAIMLKGLLGDLAHDSHSECACFSYPAWPPPPDSREKHRSAGRTSSTLYTHSPTCIRFSSSAARIFFSSLFRIRRSRKKSCRISVHSFRSTPMVSAVW